MPDARQGWRVGDSRVIAAGWVGGWAEVEEGRGGRGGVGGWRVLVPASDG